MRLSVTVLVLLIGGAVAPAPADEPKAGEFDAVANLIGEWDYVGGTKDGTSLSADHFHGQHVTVSKDVFRLSGDAAFVMKYDLTTDTNPQHIDLEITESPFGPGAKALGIIKLDDGVLHLCYNPTGGDRPTAFDAASGSGHFAFRMKRTPLKAEQLHGKWKFTHIRRNGEDVPDDRVAGHSLEVTADAFHLTAGDGAKFVMSWELSRQSELPKIDFMMTESPFGAGATMSGIILQFGDQMMLCYTTEGDVPTEFTADGGSMRHLFVMERVAAADNKADQQ